MRFAMAGSGSKGNATLVDACGTRLLIDCGFAVREMESRAEALSFDLASLDAILVTHEHGDHVGGVGRLARAYGLPVYMTPGTRTASRDLEGVELRMISPHQAFRIGAVEIQPFPVPHDAREPCQFTFVAAGRRLGVLSDLGSITPHVRENLRDCDALLLECNHDPDLLRDGPYPEALKRRVGGQWGHLSNAQSAALLASIGFARLQHLVLTHLSEQNNTPALARAAICSVLQDDPAWCLCADQGQALNWRSVC
jgi:phosphoribosyl 1,2-cyclic phosphodiesterase